MSKKLEKHLHLLPTKGILLEQLNGNLKIKINHDYYVIPRRLVELSTGLDRDTISWVHLVKGVGKIMVIDVVEVSDQYEENIDVSIEQI